MKTRQPLSTREQRVEDWFEVPMIIVTIFLIVTFAVPLFVPLSPGLVQWFAFLNLAVWLTFYVEFFAKIYVAKNKLRALKRNWSLAFIVTIPLFLPLRILRASRLLGLIRIFRLQPLVDKLKKKLRTLIYQIEYFVISLVLFVVTTGFILWQVETRFDGSLSTLPDALWWSLTTVTLLHDSGLAPSSAEGKILGFVVSITGTILLIIFTASVTSALIGRQKKAR